MIRFEPRPDGSADPDRTLYLEGTRTLVGWIERGRAMTNLRSNWTEWRFTPNGAGSFPVRKGISAAYDDARGYAAAKEA